MRLFSRKMIGVKIIRPATCLYHLLIRKLFNCTRITLTSSNLNVQSNFMNASRSITGVTPLLRDKMVGMPTSYITKTRAEWENMKLSDKRLVLVTCPTCNKRHAKDKRVTARLIHQSSYSHGLAIIRCKFCHKLYIISDNLNLLGQHRVAINSGDEFSNFLLTVHQSSNDYKFLRFDKDTIEIVAVDTGRQPGETFAKSDDFKYTHLVPNSPKEFITRNFTEPSSVVDVTDDEGNIVMVDDAKRLEILECEYDVWKGNKQEIPERVSEYHWLNILSKGKDARRDYYRILSRNLALVGEIRFAKINNQEPPSSNVISELDLNRPTAFQQDETRNTIISRITRRGHRAKVLGSNLRVGYMFGPRILFNMSCGEIMSRELSRNCIYDIRELLAWNAKCRSAGRIYFTSLTYHSSLYKELSKFGLLNDDTFVDHSPHHPAELFSEEHLVHISPAAQDILPAKYDGNTIYIIDVNLSIPDPDVRGNLYRPGVRCQRFPTEKYLGLSIGETALPLHNYYQTLLTWINTGNWLSALSHVPQSNLSRSKKVITQDRNELFEDLHERM